MKRDIIDNISYEIIVEKNENHSNTSLRRLGRKDFEKGRRENSVKECRIIKEGKKWTKYIRFTK